MSEENEKHEAPAPVPSRYEHAVERIEMEKYADTLVEYADWEDNRFGDIMLFLGGASTIYECLGLADKQKEVDGWIDILNEKTQEYINWLEEKLEACTGKTKEKPRLKELKIQGKPS